MSMKLFNHIEGMDTPLLSSYDRAVLLTIAVRCDDEGHMLRTSKAMAFALRMDKGNFSRKMNELVAKGILIKTEGSFAFAKDIVDGSRLSGQQPGMVVDGTTRVVEGTIPPPHPLSRKNINNPCHDISKDPPIIPPNHAQTEQTSRVQFIKAQPPMGWDRKIVPFVERLAKAKQDFLAAKPTYTPDQEAFLEVYPKAPGDPVAFILAWEQTLKQDVRPRELINAAKAASNSPAFKEKEGLYIPKPENWLEKKGWGYHIEPFREARKKREAQEREEKARQWQLENMQ